MFRRGSRTVYTVPAFVFAFRPRDYIIANQIPTYESTQFEKWSSELSAELHLGHFRLLPLPRGAYARVI